VCPTERTVQQIFQILLQKFLANFSNFELCSLAKAVLGELMPWMALFSSGAI